MKPKAPISLVLLVSSIALLALTGRAQEPKYKVGDRVEVDVNQSTTPAYARWKKGTITRVDTGTAMAYTVQSIQFRESFPKKCTFRFDLMRKDGLGRSLEAPRRKFSLTNCGWMITTRCLQTEN